MKQTLKKMKIKYDEGSFLWLIVELVKGMIRFFTFISSFGIFMISKMENDIKDYEEKK